MKEYNEDQTTETQIEKTLAEKHTCYVLITCDKAKDDGFMDVQMCYGGDATLASLLIDGAKQFIDDCAEETCLH